MKEITAKKITELSKEQFDHLKSTELLHIIYPESPNNYYDAIDRERPKITYRKPELLQNHDFSELIKLCKYHVELLWGEHKCFDEAGIVYKEDVYEYVMKALFGEDIMAKINKQQEEHPVYYDDNRN